MQHFGKINEYYKTGRFECDLFFHQKLLQIVKELSLFQFIGPLQQNITIIQQINALTKKHLRLLEEYDTEDQAIRLSNQSNEYLAKINTQIISTIMAEIQSMKGESFTTKILNIINSQGLAEEYLSIVNRVNKLIHDDQLRMEANFMISLFISKNRQKRQYFQERYEKIIRNGMSELKQFRKRAEFIEKYPQLCKNQKVSTYLKGSFLMIMILHNFNDLYKLISGSSGFSLKIASLKKQINTKCKKMLGQISIKQYSFPFPELKKCLKDAKLYQKPESICQFCLRLGGMHGQCLNVIKLLEKN